MEFASLYSSASGFTLEDVCFLGLRFDASAGFKPTEGESWICQRSGEENMRRYGGPGWLTGLWYSAGRTAYAVGSRGQVAIIPDMPAVRDVVHQHQLDAALMGVWGLDDGFVLAWGDRGETSVMFRWDGARWAEIPSPERVVDVHGVAPDLIYAVGSGGMIARWDGAGWQRVRSPTRTMLSSVFVAGPDEVYACGAGRRLLSGSGAGFVEVLTAPGPLLGVAKWKGVVWVGAADRGLMKLVDGQLVSVKPNILAETFDARQNLIITCPDEIAETADGAAFSAAAEGFLLETLSDRPAMWRS